MARNWNTTITPTGRSRQKSPEAFGLRPTSAIGLRMVRTSEHEEGMNGVIRPLRRARDKHAPLISTWGALKIVNPIRRLLFSDEGIRRRLDKAIDAHDIRYLDLGGASPVEGYLTIHLSPVELYGKVLTPKRTTETWYSEGLVNLKNRDLKAPAIVMSVDATRGLPLGDQSLLGINMSHFLEHFPLEKGLYLLAECRRVLRPGGVLRVSCPDLRRYAVAYVNSDTGFYHRVGTPTYCSYSNLETFGDRFISKAYDNTNGHLWFYDAETVIHHLKSLGFRDADCRHVHESKLPEIDHIEPAYREVESFYVEAIL
jgi:predicted SAM-dependent methyltransferase